MATATQISPSLPAPTRPRLQAVNKNLTDLDEQIQQATHIIGLPDGWETLQGSVRSAAVQHLICARADWVLRWILEKLKDTADSGAQARGNVKAWKLLDWMIETLPVSRCAPHLRDADFLTILEKALEANFGADAIVQPTPTQQNRHPRDVSDSSETVQEDPQPSRKRKRGSGASTPSKKSTVESNAFEALFDTMRTTVRRIRDKGDSQGSSEETVQSEHMKMVLRTESAQAARILKHWLNAAQRLSLNSAASVFFERWEYLDLSLAVAIWELRAIDTGDGSGASVDQFSTECLIPSLLLSQTLHQTTVDSNEPHVPRALRDTYLILDRLIAKHILVPSRTAFFNALNDDAPKADGPSLLRAELLSSSLEPLQAKLLQAAQIEDSGVAIPAQFTSLFTAVPHLFDLIIRCSPARTSKARTSEKPWIQSSLVVLAHCLGCSLEPPEFPASGASIDALENCLYILASHNINIDAQILKDLFWFHSGLEYPLSQKKVINWSLIAALIEIDSSIFLTDAKSANFTPDERPNDLAAFLFDHISASTFQGPETQYDEQMDVDDNDHVALLPTGQGSRRVYRREDVLEKIVGPIISAFSRNRQLLGFVDRWDDQLCKVVLVNRKPLVDLQSPIWEEKALVLALAGVFEQSLTLSQVSTLFKKHAERITDYTEDQPHKALSSAVIIQAVLHSIDSEETIEALKPYMLSVWKIYESWVQHNSPSQSTALDLAWTSLCLLVGRLWPVHLHKSRALQNEFVRPLLEQASRDVSSARKEEPNRRLHSSCRAAAVAFVFIACDFLASMPNSAELIEKRLRKTLKALSPSQLGARELKEMVELFCAEYAHLLGSFEQDTAQVMLSGLLETVSAFEEVTRNLLVESLADTVFTKGNSLLKAAFFTALLNGLEQDAEDLRASSVCAFLRVPPSSLSREQREDALNKLLVLLMSSPQVATALLNIMVHLMEIPNATSKISSDGSAYFDIAQALHEAGIESPPILQLLQSLVQSTLGHLIPNKDQAQNKIFFDKFGSKISSSLKKPKTCSTAKIAVLRATLLATYESEALLPLDQYLDFLSTALNKGSASHEFVLEAYNHVPLKALKKNGDIFGTAQASLRKWMSPKLAFSDAEDVIVESFSVQAWPAVFEAIAKYQLYPNTKWLLRVSSQLLRQNLVNQGTSSILECVRETLLPLETSAKLSLVSFCISIASEDKPAVAFQLLHAVVSSIDDKHDVRSEPETQQLGLIPQVCSLLGSSRDDASFNALLDSINIILLEKPSMTSQHTIESVLTVLLKLSTRSSPRLSSAYAPAIYARLCETTRLVLLLHRSRLGGRFHLLLPLLQSLLLCLFIPNANRGAALPPWLDSPSPSAVTRLTPTNASQYTKLLSTLCTPTQSSVQRTRSATTLNDPIKAAREYASQHVYPLLSSFCRYQLYGRLEAEVREKLMPGIWDVIGVGQLDKDGIDAMFAGLGRSEKDVWRGVWGEWVRVQGRKERRVKEES
ncbi:hypothetical protein N0V90_010560 [Kalmusia sp. IMI 367209]|nr:hypothetical protein N0V90_010560 [Kalmusia sp. IMI 367209]